MNWDAIGAIGEVTGALLVVITLIYLTIQIRQNSASINASITQANISAFNELNAILACDAELADIFERGADHPESLSEKENRRFTWLLRSYLNLYLNLYEQYLNGTCPRNLWERHAIELSAIAPSPGIQSFLKIDSSFKELFDHIAELDLLAENKDFRMEHRIET